MARLTRIDSAQETRYKTPTFDPRSAFARTLRGGEMALLGRLERPNEVAARGKLAGTGSNRASQTSGTERHYETPTFDPRGAFARTLRAGEMARLERHVLSYDRECPDHRRPVEKRHVTVDALPKEHSSRRDEYRWQEQEK